MKYVTQENSSTKELVLPTLLLHGPTEFFPFSLNILLINDIKYGIMVIIPFGFFRNSDHVWMNHSNHIQIK